MEKLENWLEDILMLWKWQYKLLVVIVIAMIKVATVSLSKLKIGLWWSSKLSSRYRQLQRFMTSFSFDQKRYIQFMLKFLNQEKISIAMDRTNWKFWKSNINILMIVAVYKGIGVPLIWTLVDKRGNSNTTERKEIIDVLLEVISVENIKYLFCDREFVGKEWLQYLKQIKIHYILRIKDNYIVNGKCISKTFKYRVKNEIYVSQNTKNVLGFEVYISWMKIEWEYLIVISDIYTPKAVELYAQRREIETMFWCYKTTGFNLEDTHITDQKKLKTLVWIVWIAFVWSYIIWIRYNQIEKIRVMNHWYKHISFFKHWLELLRDICINWFTQNKVKKLCLEDIILKLSCS